MHWNLSVCTYRMGACGAAQHRLGADNGLHLHRASPPQSTFTQPSSSDQKVTFRVPQRALFRTLDSLHAKEYSQGESNPHRIEFNVATMHDTISP